MEKEKPAGTVVTRFCRTAEPAKNQRGFSVDSLQKNSDKLDYEAKENVNRFFTKMIRNIDSY